MEKSLKFSNFKEKYAAFSMNITDFKDFAKVNQIKPIKQEHFGNSMNIPYFYASYTLCSANCESTQTNFAFSYSC